MSQLAGPREREKWKARQEHAQKREAGAAANQVAFNGSTAADKRKSGASTTAAAAAAATAAVAAAGSSGGGAAAQSALHRAENGGTNRGSERGDQVQRGALGTVSRRDGSRSSSGGGGGATVAVAVAVKCEGCNEEGHDFRECPHRSDSALEGSEDGNEEEGESDEYQDGGEDDEDYQSDDA